jgi:hypothetical protein
MATLITLALVTVLIGIAIGGFFSLSLAIRREDRAGSVRFDAPNRSAQTARSFVGISSSRWD